MRDRAIAPKSRTPNKTDDRLRMLLNKITGVLPQTAVADRGHFLASGVQPHNDLDNLKY
jgi:hypothetical protein